MNIDTDQQFKEGKIEEVKICPDDGWDVKWNGWHLLVPSDLCQQAPAVASPSMGASTGTGPRRSPSRTTATWLPRGCKPVEARA